jgi:hypothetical protein
MLSTNFVKDLEIELEYKIREREMISEQLAIADVQIDKYDVIIENMDKSILPLIDEINVAISSVKAAYENRVTIGCKSDLYWELVEQRPVNFKGVVGFYSYVYECKKNPSVRQDYGYWGAKYYRRPQNQDYGANIVNEFVGSISVGSTNLAVVSAGGTLKAEIGDIITDNISDPQVFTSVDLPNIVSFGSSSLLVNTIPINGSVSVGSVVLLSNTGLGTTSPVIKSNGTVGLTSVGIDTGSTLSSIGYVAYGATVVGVGTTIAYNTVWDKTSGGYISSAYSANTIIMSLPAVATASSISISVGIVSSFPSFFLTTSATQTVSNINFTIIRNTQSNSLEFDATNNPIDPVTIGIMNNSSAGYGHSLVRVNNTSSITGPVQWREVLGSFAPEPNVGAGFARYYPGNNSWPTQQSIFRTGVGTITGYGTPTYATEGTRVSTAFEGGLYLFSVGIDTTSTSPLSPSAGTCTAADNAITAAETSRDAIITKYQTRIDTTIAATRTLRNLRNKLETNAFAYLQARTYADAEVNRIKRDLEAIRNVDFTPYEPPTNLYSSKNRYSSSTVGFASTGT